MSSRPTINRYEPNSNVPVSTKLWHLIEGTELILESLDHIGNESHYSHERTLIAMKPRAMSRAIATVDLARVASH
jgi:hypothetical protein